MDRTITAITPDHTPLPREPLTDAPFIDVGGKSAPGPTRDINTDFFLTGDLTRSMVIGPSSMPLAPGVPWIGGTQGKMLVVADGITGTGLGDVASYATVDGLARYIVNAMPWLTEPRDADDRRFRDEIAEGLRRCQARIRHEASKHGYQERPVGTTLTMAYIVWPHLYIVHVGDSRAYLYRENRLQQLTADDTLAQQMIDHGLTDVDGAADAPFRHVLTNAIGGDSDTIGIEHHHLRVEPGDTLLLCTDGLTRVLTPMDIKRELERAPTSATCADRLIETARTKGGNDNVTAVVARVAQ